MKRLLIFVAIIAGMIGSFCVGFWRGSQWGDAEYYVIGLEQGYHNGVSDAAAAYKSGGIVNADTGEVVKQ